MKNIMTHPPLAMPLQARVRVSTGAFPAAVLAAADCAGAGRRAAGFVAFQGTGASGLGYTPAVVDVVQQDEFPGDMAWSPPI